MNQLPQDQSQQPADLATWQRLITTPDLPLIAEARRLQPGDLQAIARLRKRWPPDEVRLAMNLADARRRARGKLPTIADTIIADVQGIQMASSELAARHKAQRFANAPTPRPILDLCAGIGADTIALLQANPSTTPIDADPIRAWMLKINTNRPARCERIDHRWIDENEALLRTVHIHIDPQRRHNKTNARQRAWHELQPPPDVLERLIELAPAAAIKLAPGVDQQQLPPGEIEWISENATLTQAILWTKQLATPTPSPFHTLHQDPARLVRATALSKTHPPLTLVGNPAPPTRIADHAARYLFTFDPAPERAQLLQQITNAANMPLLHPQLGLLTADTLPPSETRRRLRLTAFELIDILPWRRDTVAKQLKQLRPREIEVKTRDKLVDPNAEQLALRRASRKGHRASPPPTDHTSTHIHTATVFILRFDRAPRALITRRIADPPHPSE